MLASGEVAARILGFVATIVLARTLGAEGFGVIGFALTVRLYLVVLVEGGLDSVGVRRVALDPTFLQHTAPALIIARVVLALALIGVTSLGGILLLPAPDGTILALISLTLIPLALNLRWACLGLGRARSAAGARILADGLFLLLVLLLVRRGADLTRVPLLQLAAEGAGAASLGIGLAGVIGPIRWRGWWNRALPVLRSARPLALHALLGLVMFNADVLFLRGFHGTAAVGVYVAVYAPVSFFLNIGVTYYHSLLPTLARSHGEGRVDRSAFQLGVRQVLALGIPVAVGGVLVTGSLLQTLYGPEYLRGGPALGLLLLSLPISLLRNVGQAGLVASDRHPLVLAASVRGVAVNLVLNVLLIPRWGLLGAAGATLGTELVRTALVLRSAHREGYEARIVSAGWHAALAAGVMALVLWAVPLPLWIGVPTGALVYLLALAPGGGLRLVRTGRGAQTV